MSGRAVRIWVVAGLLVGAAVVAGWLATRSPRAVDPDATATGVRDNTGNEAVLSGTPGSAPVVAGTVVRPVEEPVSNLVDPAPATLPSGTVNSAHGGGAGPDTGKEARAGTQVKQVTIRELFDHRDRYDGKTVVVRGKITTQCVRGCRFNLDDGTGVLFVELVEDALERVLPRGSIGKRIEVRGVFHAEPRPTLVVDDPTGIVWK